MTPIFIGFTKVVTVLEIKNLFFGIFCLACFMSGTSQAAGGALPKFENYKVENVYMGKSSKVILSTPEARNYRTILREASKGTVNYSGEFVLTYWGCGCCCRSAAIVSLKTGRVLFFPDAITQPPADINEDVLQFRPDSRLLIVVGQLGEEGGKDDFGRHYFELKNGKFQKIHFTPLPTLSREEFRSRMYKGIDDAIRTPEQKK